MRRAIYAAMILAAFAITGLSLHAAPEVETTLRPGAKRTVFTVFSSGGDVAEIGTDDAAHGLLGKRAAVYAVTVNDLDYVVMIRQQEAPNGVFVDVIIESTIANLSSAVTNMTLSTGGHPSASEDAADTAIITDAGG